MRLPGREWWKGARGLSRRSGRALSGRCRRAAGRGGGGRAQVRRWRGRRPPCRNFPVSRLPSLGNGAGSGRQPRIRAPPAAAAPAPAPAQAPPGGRARCCGGRPRGGEDAAWPGGSAPAELPEEAAGLGGAEGAPGARPSPAARPPGAVSGGGAGMLARAGKFLPHGGSPASRPDFSPALPGK